MSEITDPNDVTRILVVDDAEDVHRLLQQKLGDEGYEVLSARDGAEGIAMARESSPSLILLDLTMPEMDGFEVLRAFKDDEAVMHAPIILLSGSEDTQDLIMGLELGAVDYVSKPFKFAELRARVRSAIRSHRMLGMLAQKAQIDGLTGLWNRAYFDARLGSEISDAARSGDPLALVICDLDHFKEINDRYGHPAGDAVLEGVARLFLKELRQHDVACRYGGEEFAVIFRNTSESEAVGVVERIRLRLEKQMWMNHPERCVTASFGLAMLDWAAPSADALIASADSALYRAKAEGRNRLVRFEARRAS